MKISNEMKTNLLIFFITLILMFLIVEGGIRILYGSKMITATTSGGLYYFEPNQRGWYTPGFPILRSNNLTYRSGFISEEDLQRENIVLFLGDSFTYGWLLEEEGTFSHIFEEMAKQNGIEMLTLNAAMGGYGVDHMILRFDQVKGFQEEGIVIVTMIHSDFGRNPDTGIDTPLKKFFWQVRKYSAFIALAYDYVRAFMVGDYGEEREVQRMLTDPFDEENSGKIIAFNNKIEQEGAKAVFVYYEFERTRFSDRAGEFCSQNSLTCFTFVPEALAHMDENELYASDGGHPSKKANELFIRELYSFVDGQGFFN